MHLSFVVQNFSLRQGAHKSLSKEGRLKCSSSLPPETLLLLLLQIFIKCSLIHNNRVISGALHPTKCTKFLHHERSDISMYAQGLESAIFYNLGPLRGKILGMLLSKVMLDLLFSGKFPQG